MVPQLNGFYIWAVEEVSGSILVIGTVSPPLDYDSLTPQWSPVTIVARIDPDTLAVQDYKAVLPPGSRVLDAVEVNGTAWLLNSLSHAAERPPRKDIYVIGPQYARNRGQFQPAQSISEVGRGRKRRPSVYISQGLPSEVRSCERYWREPD